METQLFGLSSPYSDKFNRYDSYFSASSNTLTSDDDGVEIWDKEASGYLVGFKPILTTGSLVDVLGGTGKSSSSQNVYAYAFDLTINKFLDYFDLTGCYLIPIATPSEHNDIHAVVPIYVVSQELDPTAGVQYVTGNRQHIITTDAVLTNSVKYKILQPNHTAFYDFSPKSIGIGKFSSSYTKKPDSNACYGHIKSHTTSDKSFEGNDSIGDMEGVGSMYVLVDTSGELGGNSIVTSAPSQSYLRNNLPSQVALSDGKTSFSTGVTTDGIYLSFDTIETLKGVVSMSEIITLKVSKDFGLDSKRCVIGSTVSIGSDAESLALELLEADNLSVSVKNKPSYPVFVAPDFQGSDLLSSIRYLLNEKDRDIYVIDGGFVIDDAKDNSRYSKVLLNETGKYNIYEYEKVKSTFDFFNEVIVYGSTHKSAKKDLRSLKKVGRKTLEIFDKKLISDEEVSNKARKLLHLHSKTNKAVKVTVSSRGLEQLKAGDIVQLELPNENIERDKYTVLDMAHSLKGLMTLELGRFSKGIEDRFAELLIASKKTDSYLRNKDFKNKTESLEVIDTIRIKEIRALVRTRSTSGTPLTLGFGTPLNTNTYQLGFEGGTSIVLTDLVEVSL